MRGNKAIEVARRPVLPWEVWLVKVVLGQSPLFRTKLSSPGEETQSMCQAPS